MFGKKFVLIFFSLLAMATASFNTARALTDVEKAFYKEHPDIFIKKEFLDKPDEKLSRLSQQILNLLAFLIPTLITIAIINANENHVLGLVAPPIVGGYCFWYYKKFCKTGVNREAFLSFIKQYQPPSQSLENDTRKFLTLDDDNLRLYTPQNLQATFDALYNHINMSDSDNFTDEEVDNLMDSIQTEIYKHFPNDCYQKTIEGLVFTVLLWYSMQNIHIHR